jgi:glycosyltransferase involved in cell wall biosynthesis
MQKRVLVLVSTYNGEKYLSEQLDSIINQQGVEVAVLVRDDGSSDATIQILDDYSHNYANFQYYQGVNAGPCMSFFDLLKHADGYDYYAFSDQDDVWDNDKLLSAILLLEKEPKNIPVLYCSNLKVVDENLIFCRIAHASSYNTKNRYAGLVDFYAVGCTEVFNQKAADLTKEHIRKDCLMHDSWIFMICNFFGRIIYDASAHINYRQHGHNVVGTNKDWKSKLNARIKRAADRSIQPRLKNAEVILDEFGDMLDKKDLLKIRKVADYKKSFIRWVKLLFDFAIRSNHIGSDLRYRMLLLIREI